MNNDNDNSGKTKAESWLKYIFVALMFVLAGFAIWFITSHIQNSDVMAVPAGYRIAVAESSDSKHETYYVYDDKVILVTETLQADGTSTGETLVYDGVDSSKIQYDGEDATETCDVKQCKSKKKVLAAIKSTISGTAGREYIGR